MAAAMRPEARLPAVTLAVAAASVALALWPEASALFVYDRERVLAGEAWRLLGGHAVHHSPSHLAWNLLLFVAAGGWLEQRDRLRFAALMALTVLASGLYFPFALPEMARYGGLSGLASAAVVHLGLAGLGRADGARPIWAAILLLFAAKTGYELLTGLPLFAQPDTAPFAVVPAVHIIGALAACTLCLAGWPKPQSKRVRGARAAWNQQTKL